MLTLEDRVGVMVALDHWFRSQGVRTSDAAHILAEMAGLICAKTAEERGLDAQDGARILCKILQASAKK